MEITIKLAENNNHARDYFYIYEVITVWKDGKKHVTGRYLNEKQAKITAKMWRDMEDIEGAFVMTEMVFI